MIQIQLRRCGLAAVYVFAVFDIALGESPARFFQISDTEVRAISADGSVVVGESPNGATLWTETGGLEVLSLPPTYEIFNVFDISGDGSTVVGGLRIGSGLNRRYEGFRWTRNGGYELLGRLSTDPSDWAFATAASYDGSVVVGESDTPNGRRAFRWTQPTGTINLGTLRTNNSYSHANGVSDDGVTLVGQVSTSQDQYSKAYRWTVAGGFNVIGLPPVTIGIPAGGAQAISGDGLVIAGFTQGNGDIKSWVWTEQTGFSMLPDGGCNCPVQVSGVSFDGSTIVGSQTVWPTPAQAIHNAVLWQKTSTGYQFLSVENVLTTLGINLDGWHLRNVVDVSADGQTIVGLGTLAGGSTESWYAVLGSPVPEPQSLLSASMALVGILLCRRRRTAR
jgi:probable HAF family extracellular repeat protein